jgi:hypothetical protein
LHERSTYAPPRGSIAVPLIFRTNPNVPFVRVNVTLPDGTEQQAQVVVDTGAAYYALALIPPASVRIRDRLPTALRPDRPVAGITAVQLVAARPTALIVGPFRVDAPVIALVQSGIGSANDDGVLGSGFLNRFTIGFDFEGRQMHLTPNTSFRTEHPFDASGVGFIRTEAGFEAQVVLADSPADRAGVRVGDRLVTIDRTPAGSLTPLQLQELLTRARHTCELELVRDGTAVHVSLRLERRL